MKWTIEQQAAIDAPKPGARASQTLLVSAAAGSGKTAVLVERIIQRLQDTVNPIGINELLVLTFTKAAAGEMKTRISTKLAEVYNATHDARLEEQLNRLPSAQISTIHSFCQGVIKNYFYELDLDPAMRIANDGELTLLQAEVLDEVFQRAYTEGLFNIYDLVDMFGDERSDNKLKQIILRIEKFSRAQENPAAWIKKLPIPYCISRGGVSSEANLPDSGAAIALEQTVWGEVFWQQQQDIIAEIEDNYTTMVTCCTRLDGPSDWEGHCHLADIALAEMKSATTWDAMHAAIADNIGDIKFKAFRKTPAIEEGIANGTIDPGVVTQVSTLGLHNKKLLKAMLTGVFSLDSNTWCQQIEALAPYVQGLADMTTAFEEAFAERKKAEGIIDFSDLEHLCLQLLTAGGQPDAEGVRQPSTVALELQAAFKEVMVDEYQDTNGVQEAIVNLVSRTDNRFYVGDVKQSIYGFRMADPTLFMHKYKTFVTDDIEAEERRIDLAKNYRSHKNILDATNFIFSQIMTENAAELNYDTAEALVAGREIEPPDDWVGGPVEVHLIESKPSKTSASTPSKGESIDTQNQEEVQEEEDDDSVDLSSLEQEIQCITEQLLALKRGQKQVQAKDGTFRPFQWRDAVVLLRSVASRANLMVDAFRAAGIPAYAEENGGYFGAMEVQMMLSILSVIDNPEQDLLMAAVLRSPLVGADVNVLGRLRASGEGSLWSLLPAFAETNFEELPALQDFSRRLEQWRTLARRRSVSHLIWQIYEDLSLLDYVGAMSNGLLRRANLMAFYERAKEYEAGNFRGLFRFLRFIDSLKDAGQDLSIAKTVGESDDVVRIMTIHKSKGLEFPVVFLSTTGSNFHLQDLSQSALLHTQMGIGIKGYFANLRVSYPSLPWLYVKHRLEMAAKAEEERVLYVALTRAKDKLFITGKVSLSSLKEKLKPVTSITDKTLPTSIITSAKNSLQWILMALCRHIDGNVLRAMASGEDSQMPPNLPYRSSRWKVHIHEYGTYQTALTTSRVDTTDWERIRQGAAPPPGITSLSDEILDRLHFVYPFETAVYTPAKITVSEIKRRFAETEEEALPYQRYIGQASTLEGESTEAETVLPAFAGVPNFIVEKFETVDSKLPHIVGAARGTLVHTAMQWLPIQMYTKDSLRIALDELVIQKHISEEERLVLPENDMYHFFASDIGKRLIASTKIERELPFSLLLPASRFYEGMEAEEDEVFLQGIIDTAFIENGEWILVDYKTDHVKNIEQLLRRYKVQIDLYAEALKTLTGIPVKNAYIYSFALQDAISVQ